MREPDFIVGTKDNPYLLRWYITPWSGLYRGIDWKDLTLWQKIVRSLPNIYLHKFLRDDDDRALHDHPWASCSIILKGGYKEHLVGGVIKHRRRGQIIFRGAKTAHRVELYKYAEGKQNGIGSFVMSFAAKPSWTLFLTGFKVRDWGFHCEHGWRIWYNFVNKENPGEVGRGCE